MMGDALLAAAKLFDLQHFQPMAVHSVNSKAKRSLGRTHIEQMISGSKYGEPKYRYHGRGKCLKRGALKILEGLEV